MPTQTSGARHGRPAVADPRTSGSVRADVVRELPHHVYQLWGRRGCLYVGSTSNLGQRLTAHQRKPWWPEVVRIETALYPWKYPALDAERDLIQEHGPTHNRQSVL